MKIPPGDLLISAIPRSLQQTGESSLVLTNPPGEFVNTVLMKSPGEFVNSVV